MTKTATRVHRTIDAYQHARLRSEMYMGSRVPHTQDVFHFDGKEVSNREFTWVPALFTGVRELIDNSLDEMVSSTIGNTLRISYDENTMEFCIEDNSSGLPIHEIPAVGKGPAASLLLANMFSGSNFDDDERGSVAGLNGLGASVTNFTAEWFVLDVWRDGQHFHQRWTEGTYRGKDIHKTTGHSFSKGAKGKTGTKVSYKPSSKVFKHMALPMEFVKGRMWDIAVSNPKLKIIFNGTRLTPMRGRDTVMATYFPFIAVGKVNFVSKGFNSTFYVVPDFNGDDEMMHSVVNNLPTLQGGAHIDAFRNLFYTAAISELTRPRGNVFIKEKLSLTRSDIANGVLIFNITTMDGPSFDSQSKSRLITEVKKDMRAVFDEFEVGSIFRGNPKWVQLIADRCRRRIASKDDKQVADQQKKLSKAKIAKLTDAIGKDRSKCTLFLGEGDSALNEMMNVRDPDAHGCLPLRGVLLNVNGVTAKKVIENQALVDIMTAVGLKIGQRATPINLRYGKVFIATDEDEDGKHITALLVNFFYRFWPELFREDFLFKFSTPFIIAHKGKQTKYIYADDYAAFQDNLAKWKGWSITRAKGLGALEEADWIHALAKPELIPLVEDGELKETLDMIFNKKRPDDRKEWLSND